MFDKSNIVQESGTSTKSVMSQNAVKTEFNKFGTYAGVATTDTVPDTSGRNVFYLAAGPGDFTNFKTTSTATYISLSSGIYVFYHGNPGAAYGWAATKLYDFDGGMNNSFGLFNGFSTKNLFDKSRPAYNGDSAYIFPEQKRRVFRNTKTGTEKISHLIRLNRSVSTKLTISTSGTLGKPYGYIFYNRKLEEIEWGNLSGTSSLTLDIPTNAAFFQFSYVTGWGNLQVEYGDTATEYEAYGVDGQSVDIVQESGTSTKSVMSQNAVTNNRLCAELSTGLYCGYCSKNLFNRFTPAFNGHTAYIRPDTGGNLVFSIAGSHTSHLIFLQYVTNNKITLSAKTGNIPGSNYGYRFYDKALNVVSYGALNGEASMTLEVPSGAVFFQFSYPQGKEYQVEYGDTATEYEAYGVDGQSVDIVQESGTSTKSVMSQNAVTNNRLCAELSTGLYCGYCSKNLFNRFTPAFNGHTAYIRPDTGGNLVFSIAGSHTSHLIFLQYVTNNKITLSAKTGNIPGSNYGYRFYDKALNVVSYGALNGEASMTLEVPSGAVFFQFSYPQGKEYQVEYGDTATEYEEYKSEYSQRIVEDFDKLDLTTRANQLKTRVDSFLSSSALTTSGAPAVKTWYSVSFRADIDTMGTIVITRSHGSVTVDSTKAAGLEHGLTIKDYIAVTISNKGRIGKADLIVATNGGVFKAQNISWSGDGDEATVTETASGVYKNATVTLGGIGFKKNVWIFGDSYLEGWPAKMFDDFGFCDYMLDGYSGRGSVYALDSLKKALKIGKPSVIIWMMGMNDADNSDSVNSSWNSAFSSLRQICEDKNIALIPCTIPNVPSRIMTYKNEIVRNSGLMYIDVAAGLGAIETGSTWYDGLIGTDQVHPSEEGQKTIAEILYTEMPLIQG